jgi:hypothetical protein
LERQHLAGQAFEKRSTHLKNKDWDCSRNLCQQDASVPFVQIYLFE